MRRFLLVCLATLAATLGAGETPAVDARFEVGATRETIEAVESAPLLNSENASIGQTITSKEVEDLPSNGAPR